MVKKASNSHHTIIIGGNAAGLSAASAIRRIHSDWLIDVYEKSNYVSYGACGIPYYLAGDVPKIEQLITLSIKDLEEKRKIPVHLNHEVIQVDFPNQSIVVKNHQTEEISTHKYNSLVISTGGQAKSIPGIDIHHERIFKIYTLDDAKVMKQYLSSQTVESVVILGAGFIGLEMLEVYLKYGIKKITIIGFDSVFTGSNLDAVKREVEKHGIKIIIGTLIQSVVALSNEKLNIILKNGEEYEADLVQISMGIEPTTQLFRDSSLKMLKNGAIIVDEFCRTNIPEVYAAGDCASHFHQILQKAMYIPLAPAANKMGRVVGNHIAGGRTDPYPGVLGTMIFKILDLYCAKTGISIQEAKANNNDVDFIRIEADEIAHYYPGVEKMSVLLIFDCTTHRLLGAEITAPSPLGAKKIDVLATALKGNFKIEDLQNLDLGYAPPFSPVWDPILIAANVARKKLKD